MPPGPDPATPLHCARDELRDSETAETQNTTDLNTEYVFILPNLADRLTPPLLSTDTDK